LKKRELIVIINWEASNVSLLTAAKFQLPTQFRSRVRVKIRTYRQTDGQTDVQTDNSHQCIMPTPYKAKT